MTLNAPRRTLRAVALAAIAVLGIAFAGLGFAYPAVAAIACPACYGFERFDGSIYVEKGMSSDAQAAAEALAESAEEKVRNFYGALDGRPRVFLCGTEDCYRRIGGGGSRGMAMLAWALFLSPRGTDPVIAAHELSHIELHARLGLLRTMLRDVPQWFDEGVAVVVSDDPRYLGPRPAGDRCRIDPAGTLPATRAAWIESAANDRLYAKAACRVSRWIAAKGGSRAVAHLVDAVADGTLFDQAYQ